jgi:hypothetical protein
MGVSVQRYITVLFLQVCFSSLLFSQEYFYKNKFPGSTCAPLSFYISTQVGNETTKKFWDGVEGQTSEEKFKAFLDECSALYNPDIKPHSKKLPLIVPEEFLPFLDFYLEMLPFDLNVAVRGMTLEDLKSVIESLNPDFASKIKLTYEDYKNASLEKIQQSFSKSLNHSFSPVIMWSNSHLDEGALVRDFGHAVTVVGVDSKPQSNGLNFKFIDNEDGQRKNARFVLQKDDSKNIIVEGIPNKSIHVLENSLLSLL